MSTANIVDENVEGGGEEFQLLGFIWYVKLKIAMN